MYPYLFDCCCLPACSRCFQDFVIRIITVTATKEDKPPGAKKRGRKPGRKKGVSYSKAAAATAATTTTTTATSPTKLKSGAAAVAATAASTIPTAAATATTTAAAEAATLTTNTPRKRKMRVVSESDNNNNNSRSTSNSPRDTILSHAVALQPILPEAVILTTSTAGAAAAAATSVANNISSNNGTHQPPPPPTWKRLNTAYQHALLQRKGPSGQYVELPPPAVTCWTMMSNSSNSSSSSSSSNSSNKYVDWAVGDVAGGVTIYSVIDNRPAVLLHTTAWKREQERPLLSKKVIQFPNMVLDVAWSGAYVRRDEEVGWSCARGKQRRKPEDTTTTRENKESSGRQVHWKLHWRGKV